MMWGCSAASTLAAIGNGAANQIGATISWLCGQGSQGPWDLSTLAQSAESWAASIGSNIGPTFRGDWNAFGVAAGVGKVYGDSGIGTPSQAVINQVLDARTEAAMNPANPSPRGQQPGPQYTPIPPISAPNQFTPGPVSPSYPVSPPPFPPLPPLPRIPPPPVPPTPQNPEDEKWWQTVLGWLRGIGEEPCWHTRSAYRMGQESLKKSDWRQIGAFRGSNRTAWAYQNADGWSLSTCRGGYDRAARDNRFPADKIDPTTIMTVTEAQQLSPEPENGNGGPSYPPPTGNGGCKPRIPCEGTPPRMITQRRCPPGMVMAHDGMCYPSKGTGRLPARDRMNRSKKALISHSDEMAVRKALRVAKRFLGHKERTMVLQKAAGAIERERRKKK